MPASKDLYRYAGVGVHFGATIGVFAWLGYWADAKLGSSPWLLLLGVFVGFGLGLRSLVSKLGPAAKTTATPDPSDPPDRQAPPE